MIHKKIISVSLILSLMHISLSHAASPMGYIKSFCGVVHQHALVAASALTCTVVGIVALVYKKDKKREDRKTNIPPVAAPNKLESVTNEQSVFLSDSVQSANEPNDLTKNPTMSNHDAQQSDETIKKTLVTIDMMPLYGQSAGSFDLYLQ